MSSPPRSTACSPIRRNGVGAGKPPAPLRRATTACSTACSPVSLPFSTPWRRRQQGRCRALPSTLRIGTWIWTVRAPEFWAHQGLVPTLLAPIAKLYEAAGAARQFLVTPWRAPVPVVCAGNLVAGGAGKTPVVLSLAALLSERGHRPHIVMRGYGGSLAGPVRVDPDRHGSREVGDEALLLARAAPCLVSRDRIAGARAAIADGAQLVLLDDGLQNPSLIKDLSFVVVD